MATLCYFVAFHLVFILTDCTKTIWAYWRWCYVLVFEVELLNFGDIFKFVKHPHLSISYYPYGKNMGVD